MSGGQVSMVNTTKSNISDFQESGGLRTETLPRTLRDAAWLAIHMSIRYLRVDCICLVQDDEEAKHTQIAEMAGIYACAYVTFIAAVGGDADSGIGVINQLRREANTSPMRKCMYEGR